MQLEEWLEQGHCTVDVACRHRQRRLREGLQHLAHTGEAVPVPHITGLVDVLREGLVHVHDEVLHDGGEEGVPCGWCCQQPHRTGNHLLYEVELL